MLDLGRFYACMDVKFAQNPGKSPQKKIQVRIEADLGEFASEIRNFSLKSGQDDRTTRSGLLINNCDAPRGVATGRSYPETVDFGRFGRQSAVSQRRWAKPADSDGVGIPIHAGSVGFNAIGVGIWRNRQAEPYAAP